MSAPRSVLWVVLALAGAAVASCASDESHDLDGRPHDSSAVSASPVITASSGSLDVLPNGAQPEGFTTVTARITASDGEVCEVCLWLADSADERGVGLMGVTDLGAARGMAFVFDEPFAGAFYMFRTPTPLSIAWFGADGAWVGSADMAPCLDTPANECALYAPDQPYHLAVEVFEGDLDELHLTPGSNVQIVSGSEQLECQTPRS